MAKDKIVIFEGQEYYTVGEEIIKRYTKTGEIELYVAIAINKIETGTITGIQRATWLPIEAVYTKVSSIDYKLSEWYEGMTNGD